MRLEFLASSDLNFELLLENLKCYKNFIVFQDGKPIIFGKVYKFKMSFIFIFYFLTKVAKWQTDLKACHRPKAFLLLRVSS